MSSSEKGLAGRYAGALYDLAVEAKSTDAILADLTALKSLIAENKQLASVVSSPVYSRTDQMKAMIAVLEKAGADSLTVKFVGAVAENGRLFALPEIIAAFIREVARRATARFRQKWFLLLLWMQSARKQSKQPYQLWLAPRIYRLKCGLIRH